jgi:hypothetical protein
MKESQLVTAITQYLSILENQNKLLFIRNNSGAMKTERGGFYKFGRTGSPDFFIFLRDYSNTNNGRCLHLEIKTDKGKLSYGQLEYQARILMLGHRYEVARSLDEVIEILDKLV